eukprot:403369277
MKRGQPMTQIMITGRVKQQMQKQWSLLQHSISKSLFKQETPSIVMQLNIPNVQVEIVGQTRKIKTIVVIKVFENGLPENLCLENMFNSFQKQNDNENTKKGRNEKNINPKTYLLNSSKEDVD